MQSKIKLDFGVRVDQVLQGHGTTNTGNLSRKCFNDPRKFWKSHELNEKLVCNIAMILLLYQCKKKKLKLDLVNNLCRETITMYFNLYPWARVNPTVHKAHGCYMIKQFQFPIAYYSEDALDSSHKFFRKYMFTHARQYSRKSRILDVFNYMIYLSDPKTSLIKIEDRLKQHKDSKLPENVKKYIYEM